MMGRSIGLTVLPRPRWRQQQMVLGKMLDQILNFLMMHR